MTLKDIAVAAHVSHQAVSAVMNGHSNSRVSAATREKILKIAREGGYKPSFGYKLLHGHSTRTVAIIAAYRYRPKEHHFIGLPLL